MSCKSCILTISIIHLFSGVEATDYYIDPSQGNDSNTGTSITTAWQSSSPLDNKTLEAGDRILLLAGDTLKGSINLRKVQGNADYPIVISRYGEGNDPVITGMGHNAAIYLFNPEYVTIEHLEIINPDGEYGIFMEARDAGPLYNIVLRQLNVHDTFTESSAITEPPKTRGGIVFQVRKGEQPSWWDGITIDSCHVHNLGSCGISIGSDYKVNKGIRPGEATFPILGVKITNNLIHDVVRDGAIIRQCKGGVMEYNEVYRTGLVAISNGMWWYDSDSCYIQYNEGHHCKAALDKDGAPFSIDNSSTRCVIQYNYSHDNEGAGYMIFGHDDTGHSNVIRKNISINDHLSNASSGIGSIAIVSRVTGAFVEGNTVVAGPGTQSILGHRSWDGYPIDVSYKNNLFIGNGRAYLGHHVLPAGKFENNLFIDIPDLPEKLQERNHLSSYFSYKYHLLEQVGKRGKDARP